MKSHGGAAVVELKPEEMEEAKKAVEEVQRKKDERIKAQEAEIERFSKMSDKEREYNLKKMQEEA